MYLFQNYNKLFGKTACGGYEVGANDTTVVLTKT